MTVSEDAQPSVTPDTPAVPDVVPDVVVPDVVVPDVVVPDVSPDVVVPDVSPDVVPDVSPTQGTRLTDIVVGRVTDQARRTAKAARAGRVANAGGEPGVLDLTPLRELVPELAEELRKVRPRERIARALRQAADIIDPQTPVR